MGKCRNGDECKFSHVGPVDPTLPLPAIENKVEKKGNSSKQGKQQGNNSGNANKQTQQKDMNSEPSTLSEESTDTVSAPPRVAWGPGSTPSSIVAPRPDGMIFHPYHLPP